MTKLNQTEGIPLLPIMDSPLKCVEYQERGKSVYEEMIKYLWTLEIKFSYCIAFSNTQVGINELQQLPKPDSTGRRTI